MCYWANSKEYTSVGTKRRKKLLSWSFRKQMEQTKEHELDKKGAVRNANYNRSRTLSTV